jgi:hypothetical protein
VSLGVHFALTTEDEARLLAAAGDDDAVIELVEAIDDSGLTCDTDKAWDALHRCLTDGKLEYTNGRLPLRAAILGGRQLVAEADYTVSYVSATEANAVAESLGVIQEDWLRQRYATLADTDYAGPHNEDDFDFTWEAFEDVREFFAEAASIGCAVIFTVDA